MQRGLGRPCAQVCRIRYETGQDSRKNVVQASESIGLAVGTFHPFGHIAIAVIHFVNLLHTLDGLFLLVHLLINKSKVVDDVLSDAIHLEQLTGSRGKNVGREIEHPSFCVAFSEQIHRPKANIRILPRPLKLGDGILIIAKIDKNLAEFETKLEIGRVAFNTFFRIIQEKLGTLGPYFFKLGVVLHGVGENPDSAEKLLKTRDRAVELPDPKVR